MKYQYTSILVSVLFQNYLELNWLTFKCINAYFKCKSSKLSIHIVFNYVFHLYCNYARSEPKGMLIVYLLNTCKYLASASIFGHFHKNVMPPEYFAV